RWQAANQVWQGEGKAPPAPARRPAPQRVPSRRVWRQAAPAAREAPADPGAGPRRGLRRGDGAREIRTWSELLGDGQLEGAARFRVEVARLRCGARHVHVPMRGRVEIGLVEQVVDTALYAQAFDLLRLPVSGNV